MVKFPDLFVNLHKSAEESPGTHGMFFANVPIEGCFPGEEMVNFQLRKDEFFGNTMYGRRAGLS